jgi:hypothetical protein
MATMTDAATSNEPRPIKRLNETLINRIAAGEVRILHVIGLKHCFRGVQMLSPDHPQACFCPQRAH